MEMDPYYEARHERQEVSIEGLDLTEQRGREIQINTRAISYDSIQQFDDTQFHIASMSRPENYHAMDLDRMTSECQDFLCILFCKHIAAVHAHFPHLHTDLQTQNKVSETKNISRNPQDISTQEQLNKLTKDITELSKTWVTLQPGPSDPSLATIEIFCSTQYSIEVAIASRQGSSALPDRLRLAPNQNS